MWGTMCDTFWREYQGQADETTTQAIDTAMIKACGDLLEMLGATPLFDRVDELENAALALEEAVVERDAEHNRVEASGADGRHLETLRGVIEDKAESLRLAAHGVAQISRHWDTMLPD